MAKPATKQDWADDFDAPADDYTPSTTINPDGTKTVITYSFSDAGKRIKTTRRIRTTTTTKIVNPRVAERRSWAKFGLEKGRQLGPQSDTTSVGENIDFVLRVPWKKDGKGGADGKGGQAGGAGGGGGG